MKNQKPWTDCFPVGCSDFAQSNCRLNSPRANHWDCRFADLSSTSLDLYPQFPVAPIFVEIDYPNHLNLDPAYQIRLKDRWDFPSDLATNRSPLHPPYLEDHCCLLDFPFDLDRLAALVCRDFH